MEQATDGQKLVMERKLQKGCALALILQSGFNQGCFVDVIFPPGCREVCTAPASPTASLCDLIYVVLGRF